MSERRTAGPVDTSASPYASLQTLPFGAVRITDGFWAEQQQRNRQTSLQHGYAMLEQAGNFHNLRAAAGLEAGEHIGRNFSDETVYKWLEAMAWELGRAPDAQLQSLADQVIGWVQAAQQPDGYLNSYYTTAEPEARWADLDHGHEMYCAGHLFQAAVAFWRAQGDRRLLDVAVRLADHIDGEFGPDKRFGACGHPEIEMALVELYRATGEPRYLMLAETLIDRRGYRTMRGYRANGPEYHQDHVPVREVREPAGHAVRQMYLATGVSDVVLERGDERLDEAMQRLWQAMYSTQLFITGGVGSRFDGEAFGEPYELPSDQCYCETCAAIGNLMWCWRLLLQTGERRYADLAERLLFNGILSSPALDGQHYFYVNPLQTRGGRYGRESIRQADGRAYGVRPEWHYVACCPPNVMRVLATLEHYLATSNARGLQIHQYASSTLHAEVSGGAVALRLSTDYPWSGSIGITVLETPAEPWELRLRVPDWCRNFRVRIDEQLVEAQLAQGYVVLERAWQPGTVVVLELALEPELVQPHPRVDALRGCLAIMRGPLVYCLESLDLPLDVELLDVRIDPSAPLQTEWRPDLLGGVMQVQAQGTLLDLSDWGGALYQLLMQPAATQRPLSLTAIPYYSWANRGLAGMRVWIPRSDTAT